MTHTPQINLPSLIPQLGASECRDLLRMIKPQRGIGLAWRKRKPYFTLLGKNYTIDRTSTNATGEDNLYGVHGEETAWAASTLDYLIIAVSPNYLETQCRMVVQEMSQYLSMLSDTKYVKLRLTPGTIKSTNL